MKFTKGDTVVSLEKLWFLQRRHAARYASQQPPKPSNQSHDLEELAVKPLLASLTQQAIENPEHFAFYTSIPNDDAKFDFLRSILWADASNYTTPKEFISRNAYFFRAPIPLAICSKKQSLVLDDIPDAEGRTIPGSTLSALIQTFQDIPAEEWNATSLRHQINHIVEEGSSITLKVLKDGTSTEGDDVEPKIRKSWMKLVHMYIRAALVAGMPGPEGVRMMEILGRSETLKRFHAAAEV